MAFSEVLTDHRRIRAWADARTAKPSCVVRHDGVRIAGRIRLDFPGFSSGEALARISWDEWFDTFDAQQLALVIESGTADAQRSTFHTLVARDGELCGVGVGSR